MSIKPTGPLPMRGVQLIGVPSSAGAHAPGVEGGPAALRDAGIVAALERAGLTVHDRGDLPPAHFATTASPSGARNLPTVLQVVRAVADAVAAAHESGDVALLLGGDCTLLIGAVRGLRRRSREVGVFYLDGDADLDVPAEGWGVLDSCGVAHLLGAGDPQLAGVSDDGPLIDAGSLVLFGYHPAQLSEGQRQRFDAFDLFGVPVTSIGKGTAGKRASEALARLDHTEKVVCHVDVDVIDFAEFPLADCPRYHGGLSLADTFAAVRSVAEHPGLACVSLCEVNPDHDPSGELAKTLVEGFAAALAAGLSVPAARR